MTDSNRHVLTLSQLYWPSSLDSIDKKIPIFICFFFFKAQILFLLASIKAQHVRVSKMNVYLCTSTASHDDQQPPATPPIVGEVWGVSENTDAEGRQTNVDIP